MILVDTSVWVDHFRRASAELSTLLAARVVLVHPFIVGELAYRSKAGKMGTFALFFALTFGIFGFVMKSVIQKLWGI